MRRLALAGPMGSGKTTVGKILAERWSVPFVDLDDEVGDVVALWASEGEAGFRAAEGLALARCVAGHGVLALGGGAVISANNRRLLSEWQVVVLMASLMTQRARIGSGAGRPLAGDLQRLALERSAAYADAGAMIWTDDLTPAVVADRVERCC